MRTETQALRPFARKAQLLHLHLRHLYGLLLDSADEKEQCSALWIPVDADLPEKSCRGISKMHFLSKQSSDVIVVHTSCCAWRHEVQSTGAREGS